MHFDQSFLLNLISTIAIVGALKWMQRYREATNNPKMGEWSEWLANQIVARRARSEFGPAHIRYSNWQEQLPRAGLAWG